MKIYEVLKRASVHLPVVVHYSTVKSSVEDGAYLRLYSPIIRLELPPCRGRDAEDFAVKFSVEVALLSLN